MSNDRNEVCPCGVNRGRIVDGVYRGCEHHPADAPHVQVVTLAEQITGALMRAGAMDVQAGDAYVDGADVWLSCWSITMKCDCVLSATIADAIRGIVAPRSDGKPRQVIMHRCHVVSAA